MPTLLTTWRHGVGAADDQSLLLYEDGRLIASMPNADPAASDSDTIWIGTDTQSPSVWDGRIDEFALFVRALNEEQGHTLYDIAQQQTAEIQ